MSKRGQDDTVIRIPPHFYIHVLDLKTNVTKTIIGPETFVRQVSGPPIFRRKLYSSFSITKCIYIRSKICFMFFATTKDVSL